MSGSASASTTNGSQPHWAAADGEPVAPSSSSAKKAEFIVSKIAACSIAAAREMRVGGVPPPSTGCAPG
ncbi:hypothetical protein DVA67_018675 [Solirubrobacter sp. CPCC 204708]|uniref:Uncharacterized protein n=1 Tax=Solirubrobacter deserti TaxID=2282478 RepID=A0ABT4RM93_9ACTN|nr:hypothetical protein [Solirubrobacter deserti]MBE2318013.1 hypothetical protein [Solirubrobacter deserti]MDA0139692.1 hypothetical protein [Solirubrobacter deserti]